MSKEPEALELRVTALERQLRDLHERLDHWPILTPQIIRDWKERLTEIERELAG